MKKTIATILITLLLILAAVAGKNAATCHIPIHGRGIKAMLDQGDVSVLYMGSSTFRSNIDIDASDAAFDGRSYILSYGGNQYVAMDIQYDEIKRRGGKSDVLVLEFDPLLLCEDVKLSDTRVTWDLSFEGKKRLWDSMASSGTTDTAMWFEYFVTSGMDDLITYPVTEPFYATRYHKGAKTDETPSGGLDFLESELFDISDIEPNPAQEAALRSLIAKCKADGQKLILLESPHYHRLQEDPAYQRVLSYMKELVTKEGAECIYASDVDFDCSEPDYFEDMSHMSAAGRRAYTEKLIPSIRGRFYD